MRTPARNAARNAACRIADPMAKYHNSENKDRIPVPLSNPFKPEEIFERPADKMMCILEIIIFNQDPVSLPEFPVFFGIADNRAMKFPVFNGINPYENRFFDDSGIDKIGHTELNPDHVIRATGYPVIL
jgi:hypothetical protein